MTENAIGCAKSTSVYFIRAGNDGPIKIGIAVDVRGRMAELQTSNHLPLRILATIPNEGELTEARLHSRFKADRMRGEWFQASGLLLDFIKNEATPYMEPPKNYQKRGRPVGTGTFKSGVVIHLLISTEMETELKELQAADGIASFSAAVRVAILRGLDAKPRRPRKETP